MRKGIHGSGPLFFVGEKERIKNVVNRTIGRSSDLQRCQSQNSGGTNGKNQSQGSKALKDRKHADVEVEGSE